MRGVVRFFIKIALLKPSSLRPIWTSLDRIFGSEFLRNNKKINTKLMQWLNSKKATTFNSFDDTQLYLWVGN